MKDTPEKIWIDDHELDVASGVISKAGRQAHLEPKVVDVLVLLARNPGVLVTRDRFLIEIWDDRIVGDDVLTRCITELRQALGDTDSQRKIIETLPRRGYRLISPVRIEDGSRTQRRWQRFDAVSLVLALVGIPVAMILLTTSQPVRESLDAAAAPSIAVLPFENLSPDPDNGYFAAGMHEEVLARLAQVERFKVISRTSLLNYAGTEKTIRQIGQELGASHILESSVRRDEDQVRITVQLIDTRQDKHLWAESYDRKLTAGDIFEIQSDIATRIAQALRTSLSDVEQKRLSNVPTTSIEAYEAFLRGKQQMALRKSAALAGAVEFFQRAVDLDPRFALAHAHLADVYNLQATYSAVPVSESLARAKASIARALELNDGLGEVWTTLAFTYAREEDYELAEQAYLTAIQINPNYVTAHHWYGVLLRRLGRFEESLTSYQNGLDLDPLSAILQIAKANSLEYLGRFDESLRVSNQVITIAPQFPGGYTKQAHTYWHAFGQLDRAMPLFMKAYELDPETPYRTSNLGELYLDLGDVEKAGYWIDKAARKAPEAYAVTYANFVLHQLRGEEEQTTAIATKLYSSNPRSWPVAVYLQNRDLRNGRTAQAGRWIEDAYPELLEQSPEIDYTNWEAAINLAMVWIKNEKHRQADRLLERAHAATRSLPRLGPDGSWLVDAQIFALQGKRDQAIKSLREAINIGWRGLWWFHLKSDLTLESLHNDAEYQQLVDEVEADISVQRLRVSTMYP